jgi:uncharacterized protein
MSELIDNAQQRKDLLKHMIRQLHEGQAPENVKIQLTRLMGQVPYNDVVAVEQELIAEGLPQEEVLKLCDVHTAALKGIIDQTNAKTVPPGHPVHTFKQENLALVREAKLLQELFSELKQTQKADGLKSTLIEIHTHLNSLMDVEKHYRRKENLLFPFLEKHGITGPPTVMWGKHDETRELLKTALEALHEAKDISPEEVNTVVEFVFQPASKSIEEMIYKEEEILFPMCLDTLTEDEWYEIYQQSLEIGFCLYDPKDEWQPKDVKTSNDTTTNGKIQLPSGSMTVAELTAILNTLPIDITFVDKDDKVGFFSQGKERIFTRSRAILGRKVQQCHPPSSVHVVEKILNDFKSGTRDSAAFWINMGGKFIHIEYFALRDPNDNYLGALEVSQDLTQKRKLAGEQRLLSYS